MAAPSLVYWLAMGTIKIRTKGLKPNNKAKMARNSGLVARRAC